MTFLAQFWSQPISAIMGTIREPGQARKHFPWAVWGRLRELNCIDMSLSVPFVLRVGRAAPGGFIYHYKCSQWQQGWRDFREGGGLVGNSCARETWCTLRSTKPIAGLRLNTRHHFENVKIQEIQIRSLFKVGEVLKKILVPQHKGLTQSRSARLDSGIFNPSFKFPFSHVWIRALLFYFNFINVEEWFYCCGLLFLLQ